MAKDEAQSRIEALDSIGVFGEGRMPVKIVTGEQETTGLSFALEPGAIVAHPGSTVIFVCG